MTSGEFKLVPMPPRARTIILDMCALRGVDVEKVVQPCRTKRVYEVRIEIANALSPCGYTSTQIGKFLRHDHTTILYYLGKLARKPPRPKWKTPKVRHLRWIRATKIKRPKLYLQPYAGADMREYVWTPRPPQEQRA